MQKLHMYHKSEYKNLNSKISQTKTENDKKKRKDEMSE